MKLTYLNIINAVNQALCKKPAKLQFGIYTSSRTWNTKNTNEAAKMLFGDVGFEVLTAVVMKKFYLLRCNGMQSVESQPTFRRNVSPPSSWSNSKRSKKPV
jgi:hypothetical protein